MKTCAVAVVLAACAHNVPQDAKSGPDARIAGAKKLKLETKETDIVTYPGGDRVDWKAIELPTGKHGKLALTMTYVTPRPGLRVTFDVFDKHQKPIEDKDHSVYGGTKNTRTASLADVDGTVFVRVYAPRRGDAGKYTLVADFVEAKPPFDPSKVPVAMPPMLAELPVPAFECNDTNFDKNRVECHAFCPLVNPPPGHYGCLHTCRVSPPDPNIPGCAKIMKCPAIPDPRIADCNKPPPPPPPAAPVYTQLQKADTEGDWTVIVLPVGSDQKIDKSWRGELVHNGQPIANGTLVILDVAKTRTRAKVKLRFDIVTANPDVRLTAP